MVFRSFSHLSSIRIVFVDHFGTQQIKPEPNTTPTNQPHMTDTNSDNDSYSDDDSPKRRRDLLTRRPSYHRILKDITGPDIAGNYKCKLIALLFSLFPIRFVYIEFFSRSVLLSISFLRDCDCNLILLHAIVFFLSLYLSPNYYRDSSTRMLVEFS